MGTRALTKMIHLDIYRDGDSRRHTAKKILVNIFQEFDGDVKTQGKILEKFLQNIDKSQYAGCLAADLVVYFKKEIGDFFLVPIDENDFWMDYKYDVKVGKGNHITIDIYDVKKQTFVFSGTIDELSKFLNKKFKK